MHPGRWVLNLALAQRAHTTVKPELLVLVPGATNDCTVDVEGIQVHYLAGAKRLRAASLFYFEVRKLSKFIMTRTVDFVHAHGTEDSYALTGLATGLPNVITIQGCHFIINRQFRPALISRASIVQLTERFSLRRARHVIAKSSYIRNELKVAFPNLHIHEIPNTFDSRLLEISLTEPRESASVAFVGTLVARKGFDLLIDALALLPPPFDSKVVLHVFGNQPAAPRDYELKELQKARALLGGRLILHGTISGLELARKIAKCSVVVAPSREEMFGNQVIEAMLVGTSVIVTDQTAMAENVRRYGGGSVVPQEDSPALAKAIQSAFEVDTGNPGEVRERVAQAMGPVVVANAHRGLYESILRKAK